MKHNWIGIATLCAALSVLDAHRALGDVRNVPKLRIPPENRIAAASGQEYHGAIEFTAPRDGMLDSVTLTGEGWQILSITPSNDVKLKAYESVVIRFLAVPTDADNELVFGAWFDQQWISRPFNVGPRRLDRLDKHARRSVRADGQPTVQRGQVDPNPPPQGYVAGGQTLHIVGRIVFQRQGETVWTGADGIWFRIMDDDSPDPFDEEMYEGFTDTNGYFDVTFQWDDCDFTGCDDPDIYLYYETDTNVVNVQSSDLLEEDYNWDTDSDPWDDFTGNFIDFGEQHPSDDNEYVPIFIHNSITRAHRFILNRIGINVEEVDVQWPEDSNASFYNPTFEEIHITSAREWNECTHIHEYGHHFLENYSVNLSPDYCNGYCDNNGCNAGNCNPIDPFDNGGHCQWCPETNHDAWNEGWPNWLGGVIMRSFAADYGGYVPLQIGDVRCNSDGLGRCCQDNIVGAADITEGFATALLRDIEDSNTVFYCSASALDCSANPAVCIAPDTCNNGDDHDGGSLDCDRDWLSLGVDEIFQVVTDDKPTNPLDFIDKFRARFPQYDLDLWYTARNVSTVYANFPQPAPKITSSSPSCAMALVGQPLSLSVTGNGSTLSYQWQREGANVVENSRITGSKTPTLNFNPLDPADAGLYRVVLTTCDGSQSVTSSSILVRVTPPRGTGTAAVSWGNDYCGSLGHGTPPQQYALPSSVRGPADFVAIAPGPFHTLGLRADGTVWAWGANFSYALGVEEPPSTNVPIQVPGLANIVSIGATVYASFAVTAGGSVYAWGNGYYGELGDGQGGWEAINKSPTTVPGFDCVASIHPSDLWVMAIKIDGTVWTWGYNYLGQLGNGGPGPDVLTPHAVAGITDAVSGTCGAFHAIILRQNGTLLSWGANPQGALGAGTFDSHYSPVPVVDIDDVRSVAAGAYHSLAIRNNGTAWSWGWNMYGQLGIGPEPPTAGPRQVLGINDVRQAAATDATSVFRRGDGTIWITGSNRDAGLGTLEGVGGSLKTDVVFPLTSISGATYVSAGPLSTMVLAPPAPLQITQHPAALTVLAGQTASFSVAAVGTPLLTYAWQRGDFPLADNGTLAGTATAALTINPVATSHAGSYRVRVANSSANLTSTAALLTVSERAGDINADGSVDETDYQAFVACFGGPGAPPSPNGGEVTPQACLAIFNVGADGDIDIRNFADFQIAYAR